MTVVAVVYILYADFMDMVLSVVGAGLLWMASLALDAHMKIETPGASKTATFIVKIFTVLL